MLRGFAICGVLTLLCGAAGAAHADDKKPALPPGISMSGTVRSSATGNIDFTKTSQKFDAEKKPGQSTFSKIDQPKLDNQLQNKDKVQFKDWTGGKTFNKGDKKAGIDTSQSKEFKTLHEKMLDYTSDKYKTKDYYDNKKMDPRYDKATQSENYLAAKYRDAWTAKLGPSDAEMKNFSKQLSMRDINRYQFRSTNSADPGLPIQVAGAQGKSGEGRDVEKKLFSNYDNTPRSTGYIREAPKESSLPSTDENDGKKSLSLGARGFTKAASDNTAPASADQPSNKIAPGQMIPRSTFQKLGTPTMGDWKATARVVD